MNILKEAGNKSEGDLKNGGYRLVSCSR